MKMIHSEKSIGVIVLVKTVIVTHIQRKHEMRTSKINIWSLKG